jgi:hypothetical protein
MNTFTDIEGKTSEPPYDGVYVTVYKHDVGLLRSLSVQYKNTPVII